MHCCASTATVVTTTRHNVTLHVLDVSCFYCSQHNAWRCAVVTMEKVVINVIDRKDAVSAINRTDCWIHLTGVNTGVPYLGLMIR